MGRVEKKREEKKQRKHLKLYLLMQFIFLVGGLLVVDMALREALAIDDTRVFGYAWKEKDHIIHWFGKEYTIDQEIIEEKWESVRVVVEERLKGFIQ